MSRIQEEYQLSERHACRLMEFSRSSNRYAATTNSTNDMITKRLVELATKWKRFGYRRLQGMLEREKIHINHKRTYRLYKEAGLSIRKRSKKKRYEKRGMPGRSCLEYNSRWSMDFVCDRTRYGGHIRVMTLLDEATRECLALEVDSSIAGKKVAMVLNRVALFCGLPKEILTDNGSEFTGNALNAWGHDHQVEHIFTDPGCPTQNGYIESFNGKLRDECLNQNWFSSISEAKEIIESWRQEYNHERPRSALDNLTPDEYALKISGGRSFGGKLAADIGMPEGKANCRVKELLENINARNCIIEKNSKPASTEPLRAEISGLREKGYNFLQRTIS